MRSPRCRVALVVIAKNEALTIERLLRSVAPWVDEMRVLDTGSTDATPELAAACGAIVTRLAWPGDFSAARNAALAQSRADWHLVLDADEWLIRGGEALRALRDTPPDFVGALQLQDHFFDGQPRTATTWLSRVLPGAVRYQGAIHEQPAHALPVRRLDIEVGHDGYLPERLAAKRGRNRALLEAARADHPDDAYLAYQLGKDCAVYDEHASAEAALAQAAELVAAQGIDPATLPWWGDLVVRRLFALKRLKRHLDGMDFAEQQREGVGELPDFYFALGDLLLDLAADQPAHAATLLPMIEAAWRQCLAIGERPDRSGAVAGRGSHLAAHNLALVLELDGRTAEAQALRREHACRKLPDTLDGKRLTQVAELG